MIRLLWSASIAARNVLQYAPSNRLIAAVRTRRGLKWGIPAMLTAGPYLLATYAATTGLHAGGPGWLNLIVLWGSYNAMKFIALGPVSTVMLIRARTFEYLTRRRLTAQA